MTAATLTLTDFLLARIAEDEAVARSITLDPDGVARQRFGRPGVAQWVALAVDRPWRAGIDRVLAECEAKRRVVELHSLGEGDGEVGCRTCNWTDDYGFGADGPCDTLRALAAIYSDHPDYREEWRP